VSIGTWCGDCGPDLSTAAVFVVDAADGQGKSLQIYLATHPTRSRVRPELRKLLAGDEYTDWRSRPSPDGVVSFQGRTAAETINFLVEIRVRRNDGGTVPATDFSPWLVRFHVHLSLVRSGLTPARLTLRR